MYKENYKRYVLIIFWAVVLLFIFSCSKLRDNYSEGDTNCSAVECHPSTMLKTYPPDSGRHSAHLAKNISCDNCHENYISNALHKNGNLDGNLNRSTTGTVSGVVFFDNLNSGTVWNPTEAACSNINCHSGQTVKLYTKSRMGSAEIRNTAPVKWYGDASLECIVCHASGSLIDPMTTNSQGTLGKHTAHVTERGISCVNCHFDYKEKPTHMNGTYGKMETDSIVFFGNSFNGGFTTADFDDTTGECGNISCHGFTGGVNWYSDSSGCTLCHSSGSAIDPLTTNGSGSSGKHTAHVSRAEIECADCHNGYNSYSAHIDGVYGNTDSTLIVNFNGIFPAQSGDPVTVGSFDYDKVNSVYYGQCNNISCHKGGNANWYDAGTGCLSCHDQVQGTRRQVAGSGGDFEKSSHHIGASITEDDCTVCHDQSMHMQGIVKLNDVDTRRINNI